MKVDLISSGFGGQGALTIGKFLAKAGMAEDKYVTWLPSYGPEMRGGTANVSAIISSDPIASPVVGKPHVLIALNQPSIDKFESDVQNDGVIIINTDMCPGGCKRDDIKIIKIPMNTIASEIGDMKVVNMVAFGAFIKLTRAVKYETVKNDLTAFLSEKAPELLKLNLIAIKKGMDLA